MPSRGAYSLLNAAGALAVGQGRPIRGRRSLGVRSVLIRGLCTLIGGQCRPTLGGYDPARVCPGGARRARSAPRRPGTPTVPDHRRLVKEGVFR